MRRAVATRPGTYLRKPTRADGEEFVRRARASHHHLRPFVYVAEDLAAYRHWLAHGSRPEVEQFLVCDRADDGVAGFVNLNHIVRGTLQQASAGWAAFVPYAGRGHLTDGLELTLEVAFRQLRLHRVEANIQPTNPRSRALALRCGFRFEGYSPQLMKVGGEWRDHERWAIRTDLWHGRQRRGSRRGLVTRRD